MSIYKARKQVKLARTGEENKRKGGAKIRLLEYLDKGSKTLLALTFGAFLTLASREAFFYIAGETKVKVKVVSTYYQGEKEIYIYSNTFSFEKNPLIEDEKSYKIYFTKKKIEETLREIEDTAIALRDQFDFSITEIKVKYRGKVRADTSIIRVGN